MKTSTQFYGCKSPEISRSAIGETVCYRLHHWDCQEQYLQICQTSNLVNQQGSTRSERLMGVFIHSFHRELTDLFAHVEHNPPMRCHLGACDLMMWGWKAPKHRKLSKSEISGALTSNTYFPTLGKPQIPSIRVPVTQLAREMKHVSGGQTTIAPQCTSWWHADTPCIPLIPGVSVEVCDV